MAAADYRLLTEATGVRIAEALENITAMVGPKGDPGDVSEAELTAKLADKASTIVDTASGAIASFPDGMAAPAKDVTIAIEPVQAGSGDPSPTNVRPISGWTGANVVLSPTTDAQDGTTYPISWQSVAGTVYGGTLDVTTGVLTVTMAEVDLGTRGWAASSNGRFSSSILSPTAKTFSNPALISPVICSHYATSSPNKTYDHSKDNIVALNVDGKVLLYSSSHVGESAATFKAAMSGVQLVYELATPQTYQLTPVEIEMLLGDNNVWADTGDSTVTYRADTKLYIQKINAPTDDDMIADAQIASGRYFIVGGNLYKSTTTIPAGDAINPGSNCILTNLADALNALNT